MKPLEHSLTPTQLVQSRYKSIRHEVCYFLHKHKILQPGDILFRLGNAKAFNIIPFSFLIAGLTKSHYSHSALISKLGESYDKYYVIDVDINGTQEMRLLDWLDDCVGPFLGIYRAHPQYADKIHLVVDKAYKWIKKDLNYNSSFKPWPKDAELDKAYCTQFVYEVYQRSGIPLPEAPIKPIDLLKGENAFLKVFFERFSLPLYEEVIVVGNDDYGLAACKALYPVHVFFSTGDNWQTIKSSNNIIKSWSDKIIIPD